MDELTVRLDDQASRGLQDISTKLDDLQASSNRAADGADALAKATEKQTKAIQDGVSWWSAFKIAIASAFVTATAPAAVFFAKMVAWTASTNAALGVTAKMVRGLGPAFEPAAKELESYTLKWDNAGNLVSKAAKKISFEIAGLGEAEAALGTAALGAYAGLKAVEITLANTGKEARLTEEAQKRIAVSMSYTNEQLTAMTDNAEKAAIMLDRLNASTGRKLADDMGEVKSNLDRVNEALGKFETTNQQAFETAGEVAKEYGDAIYEYMMTPSETWKEIDRDITRRTDFMIENINKLHELAADANPFSRSKEGAENFEKVRKAQEDNAEGFARLADANKKLEAAADKRAEKERIASIKTVEGINNEIQAMQIKARDKEISGTFTKKDANEYEQKGIELQTRKAAIVKEIAEDEKKADEEALKIEKERAEAFGKSIEAQHKRTDEMIEEVARHNELYAIEKKRLAVQQQMAEDVSTHAAENAQKYAVDIEREKLTIAEKLTGEKMKLAGATGSQVKTAEYQQEKQFAEDKHKITTANIDAEYRLKVQRLEEEKATVTKAEGDKVARAKELIKLQGEIDKTVAEYMKKRFDEDARFRTDAKKAELQQAAQLEEEKFRLAKERVEKERQLLHSAVDKNFDPSKALQQQDQSAVLKKIQEKRVIAAEDKQAEKDRDLYERGLAGDKQAQREFDRNQDRAAAKAKQSVVNDFNNGKLKDGEVASAQAQLANQVVQTGVQQGAINQDTAKFMVDQINMLAGQAQANDMIIKTLKQLGGIQKGLQGGQKAQADALKMQWGMLNQ